MQSITGAAFFILLLSASCILLLRILFLLTCFVARSDSDSRHLRIFKQYTCELACSSKRAFRIFVFFIYKRERPMLPIVKWNGSNTNLLLRLPDNREVSYACA